MRTTLIFIAVFFVIGLFIGMEMHGCKRKAPIETTTIHSDTITRYVDRTDTLYRSIVAYVPEPIQVRKSEGQQSPLNTNSSLLPDFPLCGPDTIIYSDSLYRAHEFKAVINDIMTGNRIARRSIQWADLSPIEVKTVTNTITVEKKQALAKVYLGADAGVRYATPFTQGGLDIAPAGSVVFADKYMIDAGYYILGGQVTAGVKIKLSFRK